MAARVCWGGGASVGLVRWAACGKLGRGQAEGREGGLVFPFIYSFLFFFSLSFVSNFSNHSF
jgi:hypothetical protein